MSKLLSVIRTHRADRIEDSPVIRIRLLITHPPFLPPGNRALQQGTSEPFASFEARAVAAAKAARNRFVVIFVEESGGAAVAEPVDDRFLNKQVVTDWSAAELLVCICRGQNGTDPFDMMDMDLIGARSTSGNSV